MGLEGTLVIAPGEDGLDARITLTDDGVIIETQDGDRHAWSPDSVQALAYDTRTTQLDLDGTRLYFEADDPLEFSERLTRFLDRPRSRRRRKAQASSRKLISSIERGPSPVAATAPPPVVAQPATTTESPSPHGSRRKRRSRAEHEHAWRDAGSGAGISRRVCEICREVSIDLTESFALQGDPKALWARRRY